MTVVQVSSIFAERCLRRAWPVRPMIGRTIVGRVTGSSLLSEDVIETARSSPGVGRPLALLLNLWALLAIAKFGGEGDAQDIG